MLTLIFLKNNKSLEHLNVLLRIFFASGVFQNFDVDFWPLLKAEKVLAPKQFWRENFFLKIFIFYHPFDFQPAGLLKIALIVTSLFIELASCKVVFALFIICIYRS